MCQADHRHNEIYVLFIVGGFVIISLHEYLLWDLDANGDQHDAMIKSMVNEGLWDQVEKIDVDNYFFGHKGVIFVFKVLKP